MITGPTASGKSALAVELASRLQTEIISADSRQIYKGIPIATALPSADEMKGIPHHLLDFLDLTEYYSAARFEEDAEGLLKNILRDRGSAIICGGSMLYIDALVKGIDELPTVPDEIRDSLMKEWKAEGDSRLLDMLKSLDPEYFKRADLKNLKRVFHAVEVSITAGRPYSSLLSGKATKGNRDYEVVKFCLSGQRPKLFDRINRRVELMVETGLEEEARRVYGMRHLNSLNTVGIKEMFAFFDGLLSREEAIARIQKNTRVYAKKQLTWHKRDLEINYLDFSSAQSANVEIILSKLH
ncbi:MAG: tRNA (adenosine(37)-N6)-dimethylallyltransferase MiaA [Muribaculaceae bacterium]|nr:tRNA (adenosine(37)-N6)-dimethylallyltransferase MiaA [Muribaculaceae bacterium]